MGVRRSHAPPPAPGLPFRMRVRRPQPWGLGLLLVLLPGTLSAGEGAPGGAGAAADEGGAARREKSKGSEIRGPTRAGHFLLCLISLRFSRSPPSGGVSGKHLSPSYGVSVPLSGSGPPLRFRPLYLRWGLFSLGVSALLPSRYPGPSALFTCVSGREPSLPPVPLHRRVRPCLGDSCLLGIGLAGSTAVPELQ